MISLIAALLLASPAFAQDLPEPELQVKVEPFDIASKGLSFPSGLTVILQQDEAASYLTVFTVHTGGSLLDEPGKAGTTFISEQLYFWSETDTGRVRDRLYAEGVEYDAQSTEDWMAYRATGSPAALETMLELEAHRLSDALRGVGDEQLAHAKSVLQLEPFYSGIGTMSAAWPALKQNWFGEGHPYASLSDGKHIAESPSVTLDDVRAFNDKVFDPKETTIVVSGPLDFNDSVSVLFESFPPHLLHPDATEENKRQFFKPGIVDPNPDNPDHLTTWLEDPETGELLELTFEPRNRIAWEAPAPFPTRDDYDGEKIHVQGLVDTPMAVVGWALPGNWVGQDHIKGLGPSAIATAGQAGWSQVFDINKDAAGNAQAWCSNFVALRAGYIVCQAIGRNTKVNAEELTDRLRAPASMFWDPQETAMHESVTDAGRRRSVGIMLAQLETPEHMTSGLASRTALNAHFYGDLGYARQQMSEVMRLERGDVRPWVQEWLKEVRAVNVVIDPIPREKWLNIKPQARYQRSLLGHSVPGTGTTPTNDDVRAAYRSVDMSKAQTKTLDNGLKVVVIPHGSIPTATALLTYRGGAIDGQGLDTIAYLSNRGIYHEIYEDVTQAKQRMLPEKFGAQDIWARGSDVTFEGFSVPRENLDAALYVLRRHDLARKALPNGKFTWWRNTKLALPRSWDDRSWWAMQERMHRILPGHPVVWNMTQEAALELKDISNAEVQAYLDKKFGPKQATLVIAGGMDVDSAFEYAETYFSSWKSRTDERIEELPERPEPTGSATLFFDADGADYTVVAAACPLATPTPETSAAQQVAGSALQEVYDGKLEAAGANALASVVNHREGAGVSWLEFTSVVPHAGLGSTVAALTEALGMPEAGELDLDLVQRHKLRIAGSSWPLLVNGQSVARTVGELHTVAYKDLDWYDRFGPALAEADADAIKAAMAGCNANAVITIESPSDQFEAMKTAHGAERIDWQQQSDDELMTWDKKAYKRRLKERAKGE